jgi:catechol 2,3-dioxygenase-like lactoylglutathione lyase family enzyme
MSILIGVNHIATVSSNLDDLIDFYDRIFDAKVLVDIEIPDMVLKGDPTPSRHAFISIGGPSVLHAWQIDGVDPARFDGQIFNRGRVDHFSLQAATYADFEKLRQRLVREGAAAGEVTDFGVMLSFCFKDPDGLWTEVSWWKDGPDLTTLDAGLVKDPIAERNARSNVAEAVTSSAV